MCDSPSLGKILLSAIFERPPKCLIPHGITGFTGAIVDVVETVDTLETVVVDVLGTVVVSLLNLQHTSVSVHSVFVFPRLNNFNNTLIYVQITITNNTMLKK